MLPSIWPRVYTVSFNHNSFKMIWAPDATGRIAYVITLLGQICFAKCTHVLISISSHIYSYWYPVIHPSVYPPWLTSNNVGRSWKIQAMICDIHTRTNREWISISLYIPISTRSTSLYRSTLADGDTASSFDGDTASINSRAKPNFKVSLNVSCCQCMVLLRISEQRFTKTFNYKYV